MKLKKQNMKKEKLRDKINQRVSDTIEEYNWYNQPEYVAGAYLGCIIGELEMAKKEIEELKREIENMKMNFYSK